MDGLIFLHPWLLAGLAALPALWYFLRVTPPPPHLIAFPAAVFLAGLSGDETTARRTPWWILLLRLLCLTLVIAGLAGPVAHPAAALSDSGPVRLVIDNGWASAQIWDALLDEANELASRAARSGRPLYILTTAPEPGGAAPAQHGPLSPADAAALLRSLTPNPWPVDNGAAITAVRATAASTGMTSFWLTAGVQEADSRDLATMLQSQGSLTIYAPGAAALPLLLRPSTDTVGTLTATAESPTGNFPPDLRAQTYGAGGRPLADALPGKDGRIAFDLPPSLRGQAQAIRLAGRSGTVLLLDDRFRRRAVGIAGDSGDDGAHYADAIFYLRAALAPVADIAVAPVQDLLAKKPAVIILPDIGALPIDDLNKLEAWVRAGGLLLRFAGPADDGFGAGSDADAPRRRRPRDRRRDELGRSRRGSHLFRRPARSTA